MPDDRPTAAELVAAVTEFLEDELQPSLDGRLAFHTRVAINALKITERELALGPELDSVRRAGLPALLDGVAETASLREMDVELARRVRDGALDDRRPDLVDYLRATLRIQLAIVHPGYVRDPSDPQEQVRGQSADTANTRAESSKHATMNKEAPDP